jgi:hypothetical protein
MVGQTTIAIELSRIFIHTKGYFHRHDITVSKRLEWPHVAREPQAARESHWRGSRKISLKMFGFSLKINNSINIILGKRSSS